MDIAVKDIYDKMNVTLAMIGKRVKDVKFDDIVLSSGQMSLVSDFINDALRLLVLKSHSVFYNKLDQGDSYLVMYKRFHQGMPEEVIDQDVLGYVVDYCLYRLFCLNGMSDWMKNYYDLSESRRNDILYYLMDRRLTDIDKSLSDTTGRCV